MTKHNPCPTCGTPHQPQFLYEAQPGERIAATYRGLLVIHPHRPAKLIGFDGEVEQLHTTDVGVNLSLSQDQFDGDEFDMRKAMRTLRERMPQRKKP